MPKSVRILERKLRLLQHPVRGRPAVRYRGSAKSRKIGNGMDDNRQQLAVQSKGKCSDTLDRDAMVFTRPYRTAKEGTRERCAVPVEEMGRDYASCVKRAGREQFRLQVRCRVLYGVLPAETGFLRSKQRYCILGCAVPEQSDRERGCCIYTRYDALLQRCAAGRSPAADMGGMRPCVRRRRLCCGSDYRYVQQARSLRHRCAVQQPGQEHYTACACEETAGEQCRDDRCRGFQDHKGVYRGSSDGIR